jgi:GntR family transcriptional regulator
MMQLRGRRWSPGAILPSESELCRHYGVSRGTIRHALLELSREGLIERFPGRGSFISQPKLEGHIAGSYRQFRIEGPPLDPGGVVLSFDRRRPTPEIAESLSVQPEDFIFRLERIRFVRDMPVSIQTSYMPELLCPGLDPAELHERHLIDVLRDRYGIEFTHADEYIEPSIADAYIAEHLTIAVGAPLFKLERTTYLADSRIGEFRRAAMRGDIYRYKVELR